MELMREMARRIIITRRMADMSITGLSQASGVSRATLLNIETLSIVPGMHALVKISVALNMPLYMLFAPSVQWKEFIGRDL